METTKQIAQCIGQIFMPLSEQTQEQLASILVPRELKKGEFFLKEGEVCKQIGYIHQGFVRQYYYKNNKDITEHFAYENYFVMAIESCFNKQPSHMIIEALEPTLIYGMPFDRLKELLRKEPEIALLYSAFLEQSLIISQRKTDSLRFETATERYFRLMKEHPEIIKRAPLSHIASFLLMTPETLSRVRANIL
ncbi:Crp/Fnr family transcriptional regulator [Parabacteroides sp. 52]|uniref:Crp/Fnr family transcriptional regulator n=1 Tax=unclassified Parabacteroides TaxID=2649774 RepID=UPI0013D52B25|nr:MULTISPECIES: Crp/Fnr family transcriptional regulator [unclassified Parabacteroides]MDH6534199.1 CRP-like cAMP-binding protein [Parabacteroides sp. PM5-20]NDV55416.1 Crp/Fnr family transcriptional regulator [Parabacteroides sp. 52]